MLTSRTCRCGKEYVPSQHRQRGCCLKCAQADYREEHREERQRKDRERAARKLRRDAGLPEDAPRHVVRWSRRTDVGYHTAHNRIRTLKGPAKSYLCVDCGKPAQQWSYTHDDPDEKVGPNSLGSMLAYSLKEECYVPRCRKCDKVVDGQFKKQGRPAK